MTINFTDKTVIITGAGGGLGRSHALEFARRGANVVVNDLGSTVDGASGSSHAAEKVVKYIKDNGGKAISNGSSVTDDTGVTKMVEDALQAFGHIDILVNNAGVLRDKSFTKMSIEDFEFVLNVHLMGTVKPTHALFPLMKEQGYGRIVVTSSSSGLYGNFGQSNYGTGKLGVVGLMNTLKLEGEKYNIRINALAPLALTRMTENIIPAEQAKKIPPESVTQAVIFMCSEEAPNGRIIAAGAGCFASPRIVETEGIHLGLNARAEDIANQWGKISDMSTAKPIHQGNDQTTKFLTFDPKT